MAKMIPSVMSPDIKSPAERKIFEWFQNDPSTKEWVVFRSLGISSHQSLVFGEVDFLVAAPYLGVLALEVKGGRVSRRDGVWIFTDRKGIEHKKSRGPFEQASEAMFSIIETIKRRDSVKHLKNIIFGSGVMFPDIEFTTTDIDYEVGS